MPTFRFEGEVSLHCVHSPGTWLPNRDNLYILIEAFNYVKRTRLTEAIFPLLIHEKFKFEKTFYSALSACSVVDRLEDEVIRIELRQITDMYCGGTLLAYFETTAKELFSPCPHMCVRTVPRNRLTMLRTIDFPGISPSVEFTVCSTIKGCPMTNYTSAASCCHDCDVYRPMVSIPNYHRPTVNSALRCKYPDLPIQRSLIYSDKANHDARRGAQIRSFTPCGTNRSNSVRFRPRPHSVGSRYSVGYTETYTRGCPLNRITSPSTNSYYTSCWDLRRNAIEDAQDRSDRYWKLYRFWQQETDRRRTRMV
ncbi:unnamed protein product [Calicophoron daubneyi]|uniref:Spermatogenesis-associated protein 6 N-terminal domain-containing protein n=1 Tax=Calicophoron daubneyi TaxID=300641 RepID=A0AAV2TCY6_CALDB